MIDFKDFEKYWEKNYRYYDLNSLSEKEIEMCQKKLEIMARHKVFVSWYNTKQVLISALERLGIPSLFSHNEVLLQFITSNILVPMDSSYTTTLLYPFDLEPFPLNPTSTFVSGSSLSFDDFKNYIDKVFEETVDNYVNELRKRLIIVEDSKEVSISYYNSPKFSSISSSFKDKEPSILELLTISREENQLDSLEEIELHKILLDKKYLNTTCISSSIQVLGNRENPYSKHFKAVTNKDIYNSNYEMIGMEEYGYREEFYSSTIRFADSDFYQSKKLLKVEDGKLLCTISSPDYQMDLKLDDVELEYDKRCFDFLDFLPSVISADDLEEEISVYDLFQQITMDFNPIQIAYYRSLNIPVEEYYIEPKDSGFYSETSCFSLNLREKIEDRVEEEQYKNMKFKRMNHRW